MYDNFFDLMINLTNIKTNIKGYEVSNLNGKFVLFSKEFGLRVLLVLKTTEKRNLICEYSIKRKTITKVNKKDVIEIIQYLKSVNSNLFTEVDICEVNESLKKKNKKIIIINDNLAIYLDDTQRISKNKGINSYVYITSEKVEVNQFIYYLSSEVNICEIICENKLPKDRLMYLGDELDLVIVDENESRTKLKCKKFMYKGNQMKLICLDTLCYDLSKYKNNFMYLESPSQISSDNIMHFMLRKAGLNNSNIKCEVTRQDNITAYNVILLVNNIDIDDKYGYSYVTFYSKNYNTYELNKFREKLKYAKVSYDKYCFAEVIVNAKSLFDAYIKARELVIEVIHVMKFIIRNNILINNNIKFWDRGSEEWNIEVSQWIYIECVPYNQIIIGNMNNIRIYSDMHIGREEKDKLADNKLILEYLLDKNIDESKKSLLKTIKWVNKSWESNDFEDKVIYTVIAMEFIISNISDKPLIEKINITKIKKYVKTDLNIDQDTIEKVNQKISNSLTMMPMMNKFRELLNSLGIKLEDNEINIIKNIRNIRNDITHGRDYKQVSFQEIDKVNSLLVLMVKRVLEVEL